MGADALRQPAPDPVQELAFALAATFQALGQPPTSDELQKLLTSAAKHVPPDGAALLGFARRLRLTAARPDATVLLIIDQADELFGYGDAEAAQQADRF